METNVNDSVWKNFLNIQKKEKYFDDLECFLKKENEIYGSSLEIFPQEDNGNKVFLLVRKVLKDFSLKKRGRKI